MTLGILIGMVLTGLYLIAMNSRPHTNNAIVIARGVMRCVGFILILPALGGIIGSLL